MLEKLHQHEAQSDRDHQEAHQPKPSLHDVAHHGNPGQGQDRRNSRHRKSEGQEPVPPCIHADVQQVSSQAGKINGQENHRPPPAEQHRQDRPDPSENHTQCRDPAPAHFSCTLQAEDQATQGCGDQDYCHQPERQDFSALLFSPRVPVRIGGFLQVLRHGSRRNLRMAEGTFRHPVLQPDSAVYTIHLFTACCFQYPPGFPAQPAWRRTAVPVLSPGSPGSC